MRIVFVVLLLVGASMTISQDASAFKFGDVVRMPQPTVPIIPLNRSREQQEVPGLDPLRPPETLPPKIELPKKPEIQIPECLLQGRDCP